MAVRVPSQAIWKLLAPSDMCPLLGDLPAVSPSYGFVGVIYKAFSGASNVGLLGSLS